jgi:hypothetical protein
MIRSPRRIFTSRKRGKSRSQLPVCRRRGGHRARPARRIQQSPSRPEAARTFGVNSPKDMRCMRQATCMWRNIGKKGSCAIRIVRGREHHRILRLRPASSACGKLIRLCHRPLGRRQRASGRDSNGVLSRNPVSTSQIATTIPIRQTEASRFTVRTKTTKVLTFVGNATVTLLRWIAR